MKNDDFEYVVANLKRKGIPFTTFSDMQKKWMNDPEYRELCENDHSLGDEASLMKTVVV